MTYFSIEMTYLSDIAQIQLDDKGLSLSEILQIKHNIVRNCFV
jgi:hypothetical protein